MARLDRPTFESEGGKRIYQYVERHGTAVRHKAREMTELAPETFREELDRLKSRGYLEEEGGTLKLALDVGSVEEHETDDDTYAIRPARQDDFEGIVDAIRDATEEDPYIIAESVAEQLLYEDAVTRHNTVESRVFFVATVDGDVVGWSHLDLPQLDELHDIAKVTVGVSTEYRRAGIGGKLMTRSIDWAEANGFRKLYNSVPATNESALTYLEAYGWDTEGIRRDHYTIDDELVDEVMMAYTI